MWAPRRSACSHSSRTTTPAPSPMTKPSRVASKGRHAFSGSSLRVLSAFMVQKPARLRGVTAASVPPQIMARASPRWMMRKASPMAWPPVAHADTTEKFGPRAPTSMLTMPEAMLMMIMGTKKGLTRWGPRSRRTRCCSSHVRAPPMPVPMMTPMSSPFLRVISSRASSSASRVAATAKWTNRSFRRTSLRSRKAEGSKSGISAAIWDSKGEGSKDVIRRTPDRLAHRGDLLRILVRDLQVELLLEGHDQLHDVQGVRPEILHELPLGSHLVGLHPQLLDDDRLHAIEHRCHATTTP